MYQYTCQQCGKTFESKDSPGCRKVPKYCSRACYAEARKGWIPWNKGKKMGPPWNKGKLVKCVCEICGTEFEVWPSRFKKQPPKHCSRECSHEAKRRVTGPDHPLWTRVQMACEQCGKVVWVKPAKVHEFRFCSRQCHGTATSAIMAEHKGPTSIELLLMNELDRRHIPYRSQHQIAKWLVDISLPKHRIAIEADGDYWHSTPEQQAKDANKDTWLKAHKWTVFRFSETEINKSPAACIDQVLAHLGKTAVQLSLLHQEEPGG